MRTPRRFLRLAVLVLAALAALLGFSHAEHPAARAQAAHPLHAVTVADRTPVASAARSPTTSPWPRTARIFSEIGRASCRERVCAIV